MINPLVWVKANPLLAAGGAAVVGLGLYHRHKAAGSSNGASTDGGTTDTPPVYRQGLPTYDSSGSDYANAMLDVDTRLSGISDQLAALDPARNPTPTAVATPKPPVKVVKKPPAKHPRPVKRPKPKVPAHKVEPTRHPKPVVHPKPVKRPVRRPIRRTR